LGFGLRVEGLESMIYLKGFKVKSVGYRISGFRVRGQDLGRGLRFKVGERRDGHSLVHSSLPVKVVMHGVWRWGRTH